MNDTIKVFGLMSHIFMYLVSGRMNRDQNSLESIVLLIEPPFWKVI